MRWAGDGGDENDDDADENDDENDGGMRAMPCGSLLLEGLLVVER